MINIFSRQETEEFVHVDNWVARPDQMLFKETKGAFIAPIHQFYGLDENNLINYFYLTLKKCYNSDDKIREDGTIKEGFRNHLVRYLNYFEYFYDKDHLLLGIYFNFKVCIDTRTDYTLDMFMNDLYKYIISKQNNPILHWYIWKMNEDNYIPIASAKKDTRNPCLEYKDKHASLLMMASLIQLMIIPLVSHFMSMKRIASTDIQTILMQAYDNVYIMIQKEYGVDLYAKLYETIIANIGKSCSHNPTLWDMQSIRSIAPVTHAFTTLQNLVIQIVPKYEYSQSVICFNYNAIIKDIKYKITDIPYEVSLVPVSSSDRDEDNNSATDRFEAHMIKRNEACSIQYHVNAVTSMERIKQMYGPFNPEEVKFYIKRLSEGGRKVKSEFQSTLIYFLFMDEFGGSSSIQYVNNEEYVMLILAAKRKLYSYNICTLAEILSGRSEKTVGRSSLNKNTLDRLLMSENYKSVLFKYKVEELLHTDVFSYLAQAIASEYSFISYHRPDIDGKIIPVDNNALCEDYLKYILLIDTVR